MNAGSSHWSFRDDLHAIGELVSLCDEYIDKTAPWKLAKNPDDAPKLNTLLNAATRALRLLSVLLYPYMPQTATQLAQQLGLALDSSKPLPEKTFQWDAPIARAIICKGPSHFPRIESNHKEPRP